MERNEFMYTDGIPSEFEEIANEIHEFAANPTIKGKRVKFDDMSFFIDFDYDFHGDMIIIVKSFFGANY